MNDYPRVIEKESSLVVEFAFPAGQQTREPLKMVLDFGPTGEVNGIEIINLALHTGPNGIKLIEQVVRADGEPPRYGYDNDSDAFFLRLGNSPSVEQRSIEGYVLMNGERQIMSLGAEWS